MTSTPLSKQEIARNMRAVAHTIAQHEPEGLKKVSEATIEDMQRAPQGEIRAERKCVYAIMCECGHIGGDGNSVADAITTWNREARAGVP
jgi:hypothetical protein